MTVTNLQFTAKREKMPLL